MYFLCNYLPPIFPGHLGIASPNPEVVFDIGDISVRDEAGNVVATANRGSVTYKTGVGIDYVGIELREGVNLVNDIVYGQKYQISFTRLDNGEQYTLSDLKKAAWIVPQGTLLFQKTVLPLKRMKE